MVRFATEQLRSGHLPLDGWFPFLGLGSPQFLHYQSLTAIFTGLAGLAVGPDPAFRWSLWRSPVRTRFGPPRPADMSASGRSPARSRPTGRLGARSLPLLRSALPRPVILRRFFSAIARQRVRNSPNHRADVPPA
ncbi:MAG: hypothetical protein JOY56_14885 [Solirubrobacterales bacterium]|nr:hypothetical protein [Solirubrobacterales bacterium]